MSTKVFEFLEPLQPSDYPGLLHAIAEFADIACFVISDGVDHYSPAARAVIDRLEPDLVRVERDIDAWPGTIRLPGGGSDRYLYSLNAEVIAALAETASSIFEWHHRALPDDLHFLRANGTVFFASIGHEDDAWLEMALGEANQWNSRHHFRVGESGRSSN